MYTDTPAYSTQQSVDIPLYTDQNQFSVWNTSLTPSATSSGTHPVPYINCYPVKKDKLAANATWTLVQRPRANFVRSLASYTSIQQFYINSGISTTNNMWIAVNGTTIVNADAPSGSLTVIPLGGSTVLSTIYLTSYLNGVGDHHCLVSRGEADIYRLIAGTTSVTSVTTPIVFKQAPFVYMDGYMFALSATGQSQIYNSAPGNPLSWGANDYIVPEINGGKGTCLAKHHNHLVYFGMEGIEYFYNGAVELGSPLLRQASYASQIGAVSTNPDVVSQVGDDIYYIGKDQLSKVGIYKISNFQTTEVSNQWVSLLLNSPYWNGSSIVPIDFENAKLSVFTSNGDTLLAVQILNWRPYGNYNFTLVLSLGTGMWHEMRINKLTGVLPEIVSEDAYAYPILYSSEDYACIQGSTSSGWINNGLQIITFKYGYDFTNVAESNGVGSAGIFNFGMTNFDQYRYKHIKKLTFVFKNNASLTDQSFQLNLSSSTPRELTSIIPWTSADTLVSHDNKHIELYNLGRYRDICGQVVFYGPTQLALERIIVDYNIHQV